jgi:hypothetical protein
VAALDEFLVKDLYLIGSSQRIDFFLLGHQTLLLKLMGKVIQLLRFYIVDGVG